MDPTLAATLRMELGDLADPAEALRVGLRLGLAVLLSALVGWERESHGAAAGLRTHILVGLGAALMVLVPLHAGMAVADLSRVLQGVVAGIGFLGAGAILKLSEHEQVKGLTTAASIWVTAAIGMTCAMGQAGMALFATLLTLGVLKLSLLVEQRRRRRRP